MILLRMLAALLRALTPGLRPLPEAIRRRLAPHYGIDLGSIRYAERVWWVLPGYAVTVGNVVCWAGPLPVVKESLTPDLWWIGHELQHAQQCADYGPMIAWLYAVEMVRAWREGRRNRFEAEADEKGLSVSKG